MELQIVWNDVADIMDLPYPELTTTASSHPRPDGKYWVHDDDGDDDGDDEDAYRREVAGGGGSPGDVEWHQEEAVSPRSNIDSIKYQEHSPPMMDGVRYQGRSSSANGDNIRYQDRSPPADVENIRYQDRSPPVDLDGVKYQARSPSQAKYPDRSSPGPGEPGPGGGVVDGDSDSDDELYAWPDGLKAQPRASWPPDGQARPPKAEWMTQECAEAAAQPALVAHRKRKFWEQHEEASGGGGDRKEARSDRKQHGPGSPSGRMSASWDLADNLLDGSLSGLGVDLSAASYNMSEALLALPSLAGLKQEAASPNSLHDSHGVREADSNTGGVVPGGVVPGGGFKEAVSFRAALQRSSPHGSASSLHQLLQPNAANAPNAPNSTGAKMAAASSTTCSHDLGIDCRFQYVLAAATSIATKVTEETLTYLNQGQSYEIKLKKLGELSAYRGRIFKSVIRICFHERRLQYMEQEQMAAWRASRPGERILEVDVPLSYGVCDVGQDPWLINTVDFLWDPTKEVGVYIKVNCISTEFTPKKHGGEKGVPFRIQVETCLQGDAGPTRLHAAACQIKVFKLKGGDRKHKQDREKILKRPSCEHNKFQPSYDCTVLKNVSCELVFPAQPSSAVSSSVPAFDSVRPCGNQGNAGLSGVGAATSTSAALPGVASALQEAVPGSGDEEANYASADQRSVHSQQDSPPEGGGVGPGLSVDAGPAQTAQWLVAHRFAAFARVFGSFSAADLLRLSRHDLVQICGLADGIRLDNALHARCVLPRLTLYVVVEGGVAPDAAYRALYLPALTAAALRHALASALGWPPARLADLQVAGPGGIRVAVSNDLVRHLRQDAAFTLQLTPDSAGERFQVLLKPTGNQ